MEWLGRIPGHWEVRRLRWLFRVVNGSTPKSEEPDYWDGGIPWITPDDLGELRIRDLVASRRYITRAGYESCGTTLVPARSLVLSTRAPIGHLAVAAMELCTNQGCRSLVSRTGLEESFYYYLLLAARLELEAWGQGSTFKELSKTRLENLPLVEPPRAEQEAIVRFLDRKTTRIDALVARMERLIELLQEKRTAFITRAVTKGLPSTGSGQATPNVPMKESGVEWVGEIPAHWEVCHLRRVIRQFVDYRGQTPEKAASGIPLITAGNIKEQTIDFSLSEEYIPKDLYNSWMVRELPEQGDALVTTEAPLGESAQIQDPGIALAQRIILLKAYKKMITNEYLKYHFASDSGKSQLWSRATGSTAVGIKASHLKATVITLPTLEEQKKIGSLIVAHTTKIDALVMMIREGIKRLKEYRIALISAAVTGKIDVRGEME